MGPRTHDPCLHRHPPYLIRRPQRDATLRAIHLDKLSFEQETVLKAADVVVVTLLFLSGDLRLALVVAGALMPSYHGLSL
jgi:hypothetical protein